MREISADDLATAVATGVVSEAQAAALGDIAAARVRAAALPAEDEPFVVFRGFAEIFLTVGILLLVAGIKGATFLAAPGPGTLAVSMALAWLLAEHFTRVRRMILPSIALALIFANNTAWLAFWTFATDEGGGPARAAAVVGAAGMLAMLLWFWRFRLPFATFLVGVFAGILTFATVLVFRPEAAALRDPVQSFFDLRTSPTFALTTLAFGLIAFAFAMRADLRDPLRRTRQSAIGFWLHLLAAPALVNTLAFTLYRIGGPAGHGLTAAALVLVAGLALVIDRRSFLTAGLVYLAFLVSLAVRSTGTGSAPILTILVVGVVVTALGNWWVPLRAALLSALPGKAWKQRLPPYEA